MNLKIKIEVLDSDDFVSFYRDYAYGDSENLKELFDSATAAIGRMERHLPGIVKTTQSIEEAIKENNE